jgi:hypothetical protein
MLLRILINCSNNPKYILFCFIFLSRALGRAIANSNKEGDGFLLLKEFNISWDKSTHITTINLSRWGQVIKVSDFAIALQILTQITVFMIK